MTSQFDAIKTYHDRRAAWQALNQKPPTIRRPKQNKGGFGANDGRIYGLSSKADKLLAAKPALQQHVSTAQQMPRHNGAYGRAGLMPIKGHNLQRGKATEPIKSKRKSSQ